MTPKPLHNARAARGFTLLEVMVTLLVVSVGILGMAKLQAAAVAESKVSNVRSLMAYQAESLAGMMRANRSYWGANTSPAPSFTFTAGSSAPSSTGSMDTTGTNCVGTSTSVTAGTTQLCTPAKIAYFDVVTTWLPIFKQQFPTGNATIACATSATAPATCDITLTWTENQVAINRSSITPTATSSTNSTTTAVNPSMVLHVQP